MILELMTDYISESYRVDYPEDLCGDDLYDNITFQDLWDWLKETADDPNADLYFYIGSGDSVVRERLFEGLAERLTDDCGYDCDYDDVYELWLHGKVPAFAVRRMDALIAEFYQDAFPDDSCGYDIDAKLTFRKLWDWMMNDMATSNLDFYDYIGVGDSLVRERIFDELVNCLNVDLDCGCEYDDIYELWLHGKVPSFT